MKTCGIYGFEFTRPFQAAGLTFTPLYRRFSDAKERARDLKTHHLTGTVSGADLADDEVPYRLEAVLSFIERLDVRLSEPSDEEVVATNPLEHFEKVQRLGGRNNGGGAVIATDVFGPHRDARKDFIDRAMHHLAEDELSKPSKLTLLLFKSVETFRQRGPFLEVSYFLLMSGLEAFARSAQKDFGSNAAAPIARELARLGFHVYENRPQDLPRSMSTYLHIRNAIFHNGELAKSVRLNDVDVTLESAEYLFHLQMLLCLTVMRALGFEDRHRNWDSWIDHRPYGNYGHFDLTEFFKAKGAVELKPKCSNEQ